MVNFTGPARTARTYKDYAGKMAATPPEELGYLGIALYGDKKPINKLTGGLSLLK